MHFLKTLLVLTATISASLCQTEDPVLSQSPYIGEWVLERIDEPELSRTAPFVTNVTVTLENESDNKMAIYFEVANYMSGSVTFNDTAETEYGFDSVSIDGFMSTMMMGTPEIMALEWDISSLIGSVSQMKRLDIGDDKPGMLLMKCPDAEMYFSQK